MRSNEERGQRFTYLNAPDGRKSPRLFDLEIEDPEDLMQMSKDFICANIIKANPDTMVFAQNITTHLARILDRVKDVCPQLDTVVMSNHELRWLKEMLEIPGYQPDATRSNYRDANDPIESPFFSVKVVDFHEYAQAIRSQGDKPTVYYVSHISRLTGEMQDIKELYSLIKEQNSQSLLIVDGAQSLGVLEPFDIEGMCDVYLGMSSKFLGAEPHVGFAFFSNEFYESHSKGRQYDDFDPRNHARDLHSLWDNLQNPLFQADFQSAIQTLKEYALARVGAVRPECIFLPLSQSPGFLTLGFGSAEKNKEFVQNAGVQGVSISENIHYSIETPKISLVRIGLSVHTKKEDIDVLVSLIEKWH